MKSLGVRIFSESDQDAFALLSGDWNPMHVDPIAARRTILGKPIVHGIHALLWALDQLACELELEQSRLVRVEARFVHGIGLAEPVECVVENADPDAFSMLLRKDNANAVTIRGSFRNGSGGGRKFADVSTTRQCADIDFDAAAAASGVLTAGMDGSLAMRLFPHCAAAFPGGQLATLLATTRLVGMICPGLHSLYSGLNLEFTGTDEPQLTYSVARASKRHSSIQLAITGAGVHGTLDTFFRPPPQSQSSFAEVRSLVAPDEFSGWRALVVGGSRGLGEAAAKIIAAGGGEVCITYRAGRAEAENLRSEIPGASAAKLDVTGKEFPDLPWPPTHLLYFATPHIGGEKTAFFSPEKFNSFCHFYVDGFHFTVTALQARGALPAIFYPSTVYLDEPIPNMAEYCAAKAAAEEMLRHLARRFPALRLHVPRLPRMATDQTAGFLSLPSAPALPVMLAELRKFRSC